MRNWRISYKKLLFSQVSLLNSLLATTLILNTGCGTIMNLANPHPSEILPYGGVAFDIDQTNHHPAFLLDSPFSFVFDTLTLPYTLPTWVYYNFAD